MVLKALVCQWQCSCTEFIHEEKNLLLFDIFLLTNDNYYVILRHLKQEGKMRFTGKSSVSSRLQGFFTVVWVLLIISAGLLLILGITGIFKPEVLPLNEHPRDFDIQLIPDVPPVVNAVSNQVSEPELILVGRFDFRATRSWQGLFFLLGTGLIMWFIIMLVQNLRAFFGSLAQGSPFIPQNAGRLRQVGWLIITIDLMIFVFYHFWGVLLYRGIAVSGYSLAIRWESLIAGLLGHHLPQILSGFVVLVIARVFQEGTRINDENRLTV
jgi:hypothetical protein